jgi:hypothetical protein
MTMTKLQINLASRPFVNYTPYHLAYLVIGLAGVLLMVHSIFWFFGNHGDVRAMEQEIGALQSEVDMNIGETRALEEETDRIQRNRRFREVCAFVDGRIRQRRFSWIRMLNLLQQAIPPDVKVEAITPRVQPDSIRITLACVAKKETSVNEFIESLEAIDEFDRVLITSEDREGRTISFPLTMEYSPFGFDGASVAADETGAGPEDEPGGDEPEEPESPLAGAVAAFELPDPLEVSDDAFFNEEGLMNDPFAAGENDPFAIGHGDPLESSGDIFGQPGGGFGDPDGGNP